MEKKNLIIITITALVIVLIISFLFIYKGKMELGQMSLGGNIQSAAKEEEPVPFFERPQNQGKPVITVNRGFFSPDSITVKKGSSAIWVNRDSAVRSIKSDYFNVSRIPPDGTAEIIFDKAGTFEYHMGSNPSVKGTVVVEE